jgi:hypothetical protein
MCEVSDMNELRHATSHDRVTFIGRVALPRVVGEKYPIRMRADGREKVHILGVVCEVVGMALDPIARVFQGRGDALA